MTARAIDAGRARSTGPPPRRGAAEVERREDHERPDRDHELAEQVLAPARGEPQLLRGERGDHRAASGEPAGDPAPSTRTPGLATPRPPARRAPGTAPRGVAAPTRSSAISSPRSAHHAASAGDRGRVRRRSPGRRSSYRRRRRPRRSCPRRTRRDQCVGARRVERRGRAGTGPAARPAPVSSRRRARRPRSARGPAPPPGPRAARRRPARGSSAGSSARVAQPGDALAGRLLGRRIHAGRRLVEDQQLRPPERAPARARAAAARRPTGAGTRVAATGSRPDAAEQRVRVLGVAEQPGVQPRAPPGAWTADPRRPPGASARRAAAAPAPPRRGSSPSTRTVPASARR